jgi:hypothetical protein
VLIAAWYHRRQNWSKAMPTMSKKEVVFVIVLLLCAISVLLNLILVLRR